MKKIITLLITFGAFATSFAQSPTTDKAKKVITKEPRNTTSYPNDRRVDDETSTRYPTSSTSREAEINDINRKYDAKIQAVRVNPILSSAEKERRIRDLEYERAQRIREVNNRYYGSTGGSNDGDYSKNKNKNKAYKTNNGKHLGWEKGVGNPHKTGGSTKVKGKKK
jgi:Ni/Co efflux regulator RcnB